MGEGSTQTNKVHKFSQNDVSVSTVLSKIGCLVPLYVLRLKAVGGLGTRLFKSCVTKLKRDVP